MKGTSLVQKQVYYLVVMFLILVIVYGIASQYIDIDFKAMLEWKPKSGDPTEDDDGGGDETFTPSDEVLSLTSADLDEFCDAWAVWGCNIYIDQVDIGIEKVYVSPYCTKILIDDYNTEILKIEPSEIHGGSMPAASDYGLWPRCQTLCFVEYDAGCPAE